jgi:hypothetical protein
MLMGVQNKDKTTAGIMEETVAEIWAEETSKLVVGSLE